MFSFIRQVHVVVNVMGAGPRSGACIAFCHTDRSALFLKQFLLYAMTDK